MVTIYSARWVLPISSPHIEDGAVVVDNGLILDVGPLVDIRRKYSTAPVEDFHEAAILPGLVNCHSHLELTTMRGFLDKEERNFPAWLKKLTLARLERMTAEDLRISALWGACEAVRAGITCIGDASSAALESMRALHDVGLQGTVFQESFGPDPRLAQENLASLREQVEVMRTLETPRVRAGVSPHAPYTVSAPQLKLIADFAAQEKLPLMMHAAESAAEDLLLHEGGGVFALGLAARGIEWKTPGTSAIEYLKQNGILEVQPLLAHCIRVNDADIALMRETQTSIAHCPKSNAKLGHGRAPLSKFLAAGVTVGLGTDSVASNNTCDLLEEARFATLLARTEDTESDAVLGEEVLKVATCSGARALQLENKTGELRPGLQADLTVVSFANTHQLPTYDPISTLLFASSGRDVVLTMVSGVEVFRNGQVTTVDENEIRSRVKNIAERLAS